MSYKVRVGKGGETGRLEKRWQGLISGRARGRGKAQRWQSPTLKKYDPMRKNIPKRANLIACGDLGVKHEHSDFGSCLLLEFM